MNDQGFRDHLDQLKAAVPEVGRWLGSVVRGHTQYYGVPMNRRAVKVFRFRVAKLWQRRLSRRSQKGRVSDERMWRLMARWLPHAVVCHPYPLARLGVIVPNGRYAT